MKILVLIRNEKKASENWRNVSKGDNLLVKTSLQSNNETDPLIDHETRNHFFANWGKRSQVNKPYDITLTWRWKQYKKILSF